MPKVIQQGSGKAGPRTQLSVTYRITQGKGVWTRAEFLIYKQMGQKLAFCLPCFQVPFCIRKQHKRSPRPLLFSSAGHLCCMRSLMSFASGCGRKSASMGRVLTCGLCSQNSAAITDDLSSSINRKQREGEKGGEGKIITVMDCPIEMSLGKHFNLSLLRGCRVQWEVNSPMTDSRENEPKGFKQGKTHIFCVKPAGWASVWNTALGARN